jgi:hypothetical protein
LLQLCIARSNVLSLAILDPRTYPVEMERAVLIYRAHLHDILIDMPINSLRLFNGLVERLGASTFVFRLVPMCQRAFAYKVLKLFTENGNGIES